MSASQSLHPEVPELLVETEPVREYRQTQARVQGLNDKRSLFIKMNKQLMAEERVRFNMLEDIVMNADPLRFEAWTRYHVRGRHELKMNWIAINGLTQMIENENNGASVEKTNELEERIGHEKVEQVRKYHEELRQELARLRKGGGAIPTILSIDDEPV